MIDLSVGDPAEKQLLDRSPGCSQNLEGALVAGEGARTIRALPRFLFFLSFVHFSQLSKELPPRTIGHTWNLAYSTSRHGASLKTLYRKLSASDSPVLIVIKDDLDEVN